VSQRWEGSVLGGFHSWAIALSELAYR